MSAHDRRQALLGWLRRRGTATAKEAAERFEVSVRTLHRDVAHLRDRGIPLEADAGRGGGLRLDAARALPPVQLELDELVGLVIVTSLATRASQLPFGQSSTRAVDKLMAALPTDRARELRATLRRVVVGPPASAAVAASLRAVDARVLTGFERGFGMRQAIRFRYTDRNGAKSYRRAEPHGLLVQTPAWYLLAYDWDRDAPRMFRLDRMGVPRLLPEAFRPRPLDVFEPLLAEVGSAPAIDSLPG